MTDFNTSNIAAGLLAYGVAILVGAGPLVYLLFRFDIKLLLNKKIDEEGLLQAGRRSIAIELGAKIFCQALLIRHAVFAVMAVVRSLFVDEYTSSEVGWLIFRCLLAIIVIVVLALVSVEVASRLFKHLTRNLQEDEEIYKNDNVAMAIFFSLVLLAITLVLNEGMADFSRSLIPFGRTGIESLR